MYISRHQTQRSILRPLSEADIKAWEVFIEDKEFHNFYPFDFSLSLTELSRQWIHRQLRRYEENGFGLLALTDKESGAFIGQAGLITQEVDDTQVIEIGYHVLPEYRGKGYATEAAVFLREFAFRNNITDSIVSLIHVDNLRSQSVAQKNGMRRDKQIVFRDLPIYIYKIEKGGTT